MNLAAQTGPLIGLVTVALTVGALSVSGRRREHRGLDLAMALGLLAWMVFLVWQARFSPRPPGPVDEFIEHMGYQLCVAAACELALAGAQVARRLTGLAWTLQVIGGGALLFGWSWSGEPGWFALWEASNWAIVGTLLALLLARWRAYRRERAVGVALLSVALLLHCLLADFWHHPTSRLATAGMFIYPTALLALWFMVSAQIRARSGAASRGLGDLQRQRIAQDVHDGVGSQLVAILSSLDLENPEQQALALSLEQCLLDLKITVDTLSQDSPCLVEGLAMLRYRLQPSLQRLGVHLEWDIEDHPALDQLPSLSVTHSLRIAQEAAANVLRHAQAGRLKVSCRFVDASNHVLFEVSDDGRGLPTAAPTREGRGLKGMRRRAQEAGLRLAITSAPGSGTTVQVTIPGPAPHR
jgi:signal transduction histidine kinase